MPAQSKRKLLLAANAEKARDSLAIKKQDEHHQTLESFMEENHQLRDQLEQQKMLQMELRSALQRAEKREHSLELPSLPRLGTGQTLCGKSKAIVCRVLQFARVYCGQHAVEWTSSVTGIWAETLRSYEKETDIHLTARSVEEGTVAYKLPSCSSAPQKSFKDRVVEQIDEEGKLLIEQAVDEIHRSERPVTLKNLHSMLSVNLLSGSTLTIKKLSILLHHLKYSHRKIDNRAVLFDNPSVIRSRERYLS
ncbi:hypothetical protein L596_016927 [Steinernema carpocapsae]|uniref:Uncharacterized protein n=1 Tax=Steinernema carpocapsae TaxID=34508 RepID=A0A4U5N028_STECR|nr:hypothetical protein L596_016927 [Steinernema carpocapsae]